MSKVHVTQNEESLDLICLRHYGSRVGAVEQVLEANPAIAAVAHRLPSGQKISLPDLDVNVRQQAVRLWD